MFLNWITQLVKAAVLKGFREAAEELDLTASPPEAGSLEWFKGRAALPSPAAGSDAETNGRARKPAKA